MLWQSIENSFKVYLRRPVNVLDNKPNNREHPCTILRITDVFARMLRGINSRSFSIHRESGRSGSVLNNHPSKCVIGYILHRSLRGVAIG